MKNIAVIALAIALPAGAAFAQEAQPAKEAAPIAKQETAQKQEEAKPVSVTIEKAVIAVSIDNKMPVGEAATFEENAGSVYCWSQIGEASEPTSIKHVWYHEGEKVAEIDLTAPAAGYRTWSNKKILPGLWKVEITDSANSVLKSLEFTVTKSAETTTEPVKETKTPAAAPAEEKPATK
ncbi:MAG: DUF2914 domain-containing protein [Elusimicrobiaceae bacterium]